MDFLMSLDTTEEFLWKYFVYWIIRTHLSSIACTYISQLADFTIAAWITATGHTNIFLTKGNGVL